MPNSKLIRSMLIPYMLWENKLYFMCMRPSNSGFGGFEYQFAKGRIEDGEASNATAIREGSEELGITYEQCTNLNYVATVMNGTCDLFVCQFHDFFAHPRSTEETLHVAFISEDEFALIGREWQKPIGVLASKYIKTHLID